MLERDPKPCASSAGNGNTLSTVGVNKGSDVLFVSVILAAVIRHRNRTRPHGTRHAKIIITIKVDWQWRKGWSPNSAHRSVVFSFVSCQLGDFRGGLEHSCHVGAADKTLSAGKSHLTGFAWLILVWGVTLFREFAGQRARGDRKESSRSRWRLVRPYILVDLSQRPCTRLGFC